MTSSFADLKAARDSRQGKGLVSSESSDPAQSSPSEDMAVAESFTQVAGPSTPLATMSYPDFPSNIEIRQTPSAGRSLFATRPIPKATRITTTTPLAFALSTPCLDSYCSYCWLSPYEISVKKGDIAGTGSVSGSLGKGLSRCAGCGITRYCSRECQVAAWGTHAVECKALKVTRVMSEEKAASTGGSSSAQNDWIPPESVRALAKICWSRRKTGKALSTNTSTTSNPYSQVRALQSHRSSLTPTEREPFAKLAIELARYLSAGEPDAWGVVPDGKSGEKQLKMVDMRSFGFEGVEEVMDLCCAFASNSFTLSSSTLTPIGVSISPLIALINHSCEPNAVVVFPSGGRPGEKGMQVIALRDLAAGEEILTSYIDVAVPFHLRQKALKQTYHFDCQCTLCSKSLTKRKTGKGAWVDPRWAVKHPGCGSGGISAMPDLALGLADCVCNACGEESEVIVGRIRNLNTVAEKILSASGKNVEVDLADLASTIQALQELLPISSHPLLPLLRIQSLVLSETIYASEQSASDLFAAIQALALHWKGSQVVYVPNQPTLGIMLAELGKLLNAEAESDGAKGRPSGSGAGLAINLPTDVAGRMGLARETMVNALNVLRVGFGRSGGLVGKELEILVEGITREMSIHRR